MKLRLAFGWLALMLGSPIVFDASAVLVSRPGAMRDVGELVSRPELPDPLVMFGGERVETKKQWLKKRRPELTALFQHYMYGTMPPAPWKPQFTVERVDRTVFDGKATLKQVTINLTKKESPAIHPLLACRRARDLRESGFVAPLLRRLHRRDELLVGRDPARDRQRTIGLGVKLALAHPHGVSPVATRW